jgi:hypothetical protein
MQVLFTVDRHLGAGPLRFGMTRAQVRTAVADAFETLQRRPDANLADHFDAAGVFAYYTDEGRLEAAEFCRPARVQADGLDLLNTPVDHLIRTYGREDAALEIDGAGFVSRHGGVGAYTGGEFTAPPECVIVFRPGYYDE